MSNASRTVLRVLIVVTLFALVSLPRVSAEDWYRVESKDGGASVLFPNRAEENLELVDKTPAGAVVTRAAEHQGEGIFMSISETKLPTIAVKFAGPKVIFKNSKGAVLNKSVGREISSKRIEVDGADAAMVMRYESVNFDDEGHPGYTGVAVFVIVNGIVYVVNSMISKETPDNAAMQDKLLESVRIHQ